MEAIYSKNKQEKAYAYIGPRYEPTTSF